LFFLAFENATSEIDLHLVPMQLQSKETSKFRFALLFIYIFTFTMMHAIIIYRLMWMYLHVYTALN